MGTRALDLRRGMGVKYKDGIWVVFSREHIVKGKGQSYVQIELKHTKTGQIIGQRFRVNESLEEAFLDRKTMEYLYREGKNYIVMDNETFEQHEIPAELIGDDSVYMKENTDLEIAFAEGELISVELPNIVELKVVDTPPAIKGATATNQLKDAVCDTGAKVKVPPFVENGTVIKVDTRTGEYLGRV